ncbi:MAG: hypothetical protein JW790_00755 [Dehalococcoidales bacterium]|nr:hypothetical protein [Dehalococcoidales bacterium]
MVSLWVPIVVAIIAAVSGYLVRGFDKRKEREAEEYRRKEERYINLILCLRGLVVSSENKALREKFLDELNLAWLYCSDDVISKINSLMCLIPVGGSTKGKTASTEEIMTAFGGLFLAIRKDLISRKLIKKTDLKNTDFTLYKAG